MGAPLKEKGRLTTSAQKGFSLIEALIAMVIVGIVAAGISRTILDGRWALSNDEARNQANYKAARLIDSLSACGIGGVENGTRVLPCSSTEDHVSFNCRATIKPYAEAVTGRPTSKQVAIEVSWEINRGAHSIRLEGVIE